MCLKVPRKLLRLTKSKSGDLDQGDVRFQRYAGMWQPVIDLDDRPNTHQIVYENSTFWGTASP